MEPTLARMAKRAVPEKSIYAVARFSDASAEESLRTHGVETVKADLLDRSQIARLPKAPNVVFMAGQKFGTTGAPSADLGDELVPPRARGRSHAGEPDRRVSTGCVVPVRAGRLGGSTEDSPLTPLGEYANSCVGRERILQWHSEKHGTPGRSSG